MRKVTATKSLRKGMLIYSIRAGVAGKGEVLFRSQGSKNIGATAAYERMEQFLQENDHLMVVNRKGFDQE
jgi:hypothetical protein